MPSIQFSQMAISPSTYSSVITDATNSGGGLISTATSGASSPTSLSSILGPHYLRIYKGVMPTFVTFTDVTSQSSNLLISTTLSTSSSYALNGWVNTSYQIVVGITPSPATATASGTATWFLLTKATASMSSVSATIGAVGLTGSGADLEISDVNITSGNYYLSSGIYLNYPQIWTF